MKKQLIANDFLNETARLQLDRKRLIFTVTTGRSGTGFLAELLDLLPATTSCHEAEPEFSEVLRGVQSQPLLATKFWLEKKLPQIAKSPHKNYIETSHLVCKGFLEPLVELGIIPDLILLFRGHREVAKSLLQLNTIPGRTEKALKYYLSPVDPGVLQLADWESLHDYQLCYWYCLEIERRRKQYTKMFTSLGANIVETSIDELKTYKGAYQLLKSLDLPSYNLHFWRTYSKRKNISVNKKLEMKNTIELSLDYPQLEKEVELLVNR